MRRYQWPIIGTGTYVVVSMAAWIVFLTRFHGLGSYAKSEEELANNSLELLFRFAVLFPSGLAIVAMSWLLAPLRPRLRSALTVVLIVGALAIGSLLLYLASSTSNTTA
ncbi:hypothetical protein GCM10009838_44900 [Catenulispora subtropica]|uniref:Uncharacterized protein n=1 Tax=Catenulispora subtropica TaxID=450798 RepID=A0ABN2S2M8_9ACTN